MPIVSTIFKNSIVGILQNLKTNLKISTSKFMEKFTFGEMNHGYIYPESRPSQKKVIDINNAKMCTIKLFSQFHNQCIAFKVFICYSCKETESTQKLNLNL